MRKIIFFLCLLLSKSYAQENLYKSLIAEDEYVSIELRTEGSSIIAFRQLIDKDQTVRSSLYNLADFEPDEKNHRFTRPLSGTFWLIPFAGGSAKEIDESFCINCFCNTRGSCSVGLWIGNRMQCVDAPGEPCAGCCVMEFSFGDCVGGMDKVTGGGIVIEAKTIKIIDK